MKKDSSCETFLAVFQAGLDIHNGTFIGCTSWELVLHHTKRPHVM